MRHGPFVHGERVPDAIESVTVDGTEPAGPGRVLARRTAVLAAAGGVLLQLLHPLVEGPALRAATPGSICLLALACTAHLLAHHGPVTTLRAVVTACGVGLGLEAVGLRTGIPFGSYHYTESLGPRVLGVPWIVPLAWLTIAWPCLVLARRLAAGAGRTAEAGGAAGTDGADRRAPSRSRVVLLGATTMAAWDLVWDPQLVAAGHWVWSHPRPGLPGVDGVPVTNALGWLLGGALLTALLDLAVPGSPGSSSPGSRAGAGRRSGPAGTAAVPGGTAGSAVTAGSAREREAVPAALLAWTWSGSVLANLVFFGEPALAGYGAVALGTTVLPYLRSLAGAGPAARGGVRAR